jgi:hypothetical protein
MSRRLHRRWPNVANPHRYSERMLWRKLIDHDPQFAVFADKLATKEYVERRCPELPQPRTLWVGRSADEIPDDVLRGDVFVKASHGCGFNWRVRDGPCDRAALRRACEEWMATVYGARFGEWAYSQVEPRLFVEEAVGDAAAGLLEFDIRAAHGKAILGSVLGRCKQPDQWLVSLGLNGLPTHGTRDRTGDPIQQLPAGMEVRESYLRAVRFAERVSEGWTTWARTSSGTGASCTAARSRSIPRPD